MSKYYDSYLVPIGLSNNQYALLVDLARLGEASVTDVARFTGLERSTLVRTLRPLIDKELIVDTAEKGHRSKVLKLTDKGEKTLDKGRNLWFEAQRGIEERIGYAKIQQLEEILAKLAE